MGIAVAICAAAMSRLAFERTDPAATENSARTHAKNDGFDHRGRGGRYQK
jgi:hypothetical protein